MKLSEFDYVLPGELIAKYPLQERDMCRLMVVDRKTGSITHRTFKDIPGYLNEKDLLVLNDTKVMPARLFGRRKTGGKVELFIINAHCVSVNQNTLTQCNYEALVRPSGRLKEGEKIRLESGAEAEVLGRGEVGRMVKFDRPINEILKSGHMPLPPYIDRDDEVRDRDDYQTVYSNKEGATASPTAGLHFTKELIETVRGQGAAVKFVTLHTNYGTFAPIKTDDVESHKMHREYFELPSGTMEAVRETKKNGGKIFAVGTTSNRVLEYCAKEIASPVIARPASQAEAISNDGLAMTGYTDMYIYPGYKFKIVDRMITNFHLPKSTLMLLVSAFAGKDLILEAYRRAVEEKYRFFSYGDAMLIL